MTPPGTVPCQHNVGSTHGVATLRGRPPGGVTSRIGASGSAGVCRTTQTEQLGSARSRASASTFSRSEPCVAPGPVEGRASTGLPTWPSALLGGTRSHPFRNLDHQCQVRREGLPFDRRGVTPGT